MAVSQVAGFVHTPKRLHELALIHIGRYLKGTVDRGLILKPKDSISLKTNIFVDAAFAGDWGV